METKLCWCYKIINNHPMGVSFCEGEGSVRLNKKRFLSSIKKKNGVDINRLLIVE